MGQGASLAKVKRVLPASATQLLRGGPSSRPVDREGLINTIAQLEACRLAAIAAIMRAENTLRDVAPQ
jgi:hypothetical protein